MGALLTQSVSYTTNGNKLKKMLQKSNQASNVQNDLEKELIRLKHLIPFDDFLAVRWNPYARVGLSGEVVGSTIHIYEEDPLKAIATLRHEYLDCILTRKLVKPLISIVNTFVKLKENEIYMEKERVVHAFSRIIRDYVEK
jgi:hypothetical protein